MKKRNYIGATALIAIMLAGSGSLAYFTSARKAHNVITTGGVDIQIVEKTRTENGTLVDFPEDGIHGLMPGMTASKIVSVENTGKSSAWIRVRVESEIQDQNGQNLPLNLNDGTGVLSFVSKNGWTLEDDGYYYYKEPVESGETTSVLFDEVVLAQASGNEYQNAKADLTVYAEAVQTANNGDTAQEAIGWKMVETDQEG